MENILLPIANRISNQKYMVAIRDAFIFTLPISLIGSMMLLIANFRVNLLDPNLPLEKDPFQKFMSSIFGKTWNVFFTEIFNVSVGLISIIVVLSAAYNLCKLEIERNPGKYEVVNPLLVSITAVVSAFLVYPKADGGDLGLVWTGSSFGAQTIFTGLIVSILVTKIYLKMSQTRLRIKVEMVPPNILSAFDAIIPMGTCVIVVNLIQHIILAAKFDGLQGLIFSLVQTPLQAVGTSVFGFIAIIFAGNLLFFFGIHQSAISPIQAPIFTVNDLKLLEEYKSGVDVWHMSGATMANIHSFICNLGGTGSTIGLIIAIYIVGRKSSHYREMVKLCSTPGIFGINEPMIYGLPIVLNPILFIPFVFGPVITAGTYYWLTLHHVIPNIPIAVPWTTPPFLNVFLASGGQIVPVIAQAICLVFVVVLYIPFVKIAVDAEQKKLTII